MTTKTQQAFIDKVSPGAIQSQQEYGVLASLTIAQAILESGWGKSSIGNNIFGIKAGSSWKGKTQTVPTKEFYNGKWVTIQAKFRDYDSIEDSIKDHAQLFKNLPRYHNLLGETDYKRATYLVWKDGYATDPDYPNKLNAIIETHKLYEYDKQVEKQSLTMFPSALWLVQHLGISDGSRPKDPLTREEQWEMFRRFVVVLRDKGVELVESAK